MIAWIPVSERLPESPCYILATIDDEEEHRDRFVGEVLFIPPDKWLLFGREPVEVLAWMPLPEPWQRPSE